MLSGNCQAGPLFRVVDAGSLSNAFDSTSGSTFRENIDQNILKWTWVTPVYQLANPLLTHAQPQRTTAHCQLRRGNCQ